MKADIVTLCYAAQAENNKLSILGALNRIVAPELPFAVSPFWVALRVLLEANDGGNRTLKVVILDGDGKVAAQADAGLNLPEGLDHQIGTINMALPISGINIQAYGEHAIDILLDNVLVLRSSFFVTEK